MVEKVLVSKICFEPSVSTMEQCINNLLENE